MVAMNVSDSCFGPAATCDGALESSRPAGGAASLLLQARTSAVPARARAMLTADLARVRDEVTVLMAERSITSLGLLHGASGAVPPLDTSGETIGSPVLFNDTGTDGQRRPAVLARLGSTQRATSKVTM